MNNDLVACPPGVRQKKGQHNLDNTSNGL